MNMASEKNLRKKFVEQLHYGGLPSQAFRHIKTDICRKNYITLRMCRGL